MSGQALSPTWRLALRFGLRNGRLATVLGLAILFGWLLLALFAPWVAPFDPIAQNTDIRLLGPSLAHPFGTDNFGRDVLSRVIWGARIDLQISVIGVVFPFLIGTCVGALAGYIGGRFDTICMRLIDIILAFPFLVLMLAIMAILEIGRAHV